ncbi:hypothetical protein L2E82_37132 [Cichorium intybus]|uniref:Uncharacterized protein n=1 Tax=Cichorium intybus TaxID=13427 RepID=A0ACB9ADZ3_CICIN|nr:hypothetical protein L2E82_37132 [Cichorium intybus]
MGTRAPLFLYLHHFITTPSFFFSSSRLHLLSYYCSSRFERFGGAHLAPDDTFWVVSSAIIDKYIGESARLIREMFNYARDHQPCIIFMDEIDAIGGRRFSEGTSADREIQRTLMELLNQLDGFDQLGKVKMIMATNRPDVLDPALLRPGRLDRKIEIPLPNEQSRMEILNIHAAGIAKHGEIDYEAVVKLAEGFNGADLRNVCTEAGMSAIRAERDYVIHEDFMKVEDLEEKRSVTVHEDELTIEE